MAAAARARWRRAAVLVAGCALAALGAWRLSAILWSARVGQVPAPPPAPLGDLPQRRVPDVRDVPVAHLHAALDDVIQKQPQLCGHLAKLQAFLREASARQPRANNTAQRAGVRVTAAASAAVEQLAGGHRFVGGTQRLRAPGVVVTSCFQTGYDPIYQGAAGRRDAAGGVWGYLALWYASVVAAGVPAVVFHDGLPPALVKARSTELVRFVRVDLRDGRYSLNDVRFHVYHQWLACCADVSYVLMADIRDTLIARNPFDLMAGLDDGWDLFVNTDRANDWMRERFAELQYDMPPFEVLFNAGVWGGKKAAVMDTLAHMLAEFGRLYPLFLNLQAPPGRQRLPNQATTLAGQRVTLNFDMAVLNMALFHRVAPAWRVYTGAPLCAGLLHCELFFQCDYFVYHKALQPGELPPCAPLAVLPARLSGAPLLRRRRQGAHNGAGGRQNMTTSAGLRAAQWYVEGEGDGSMVDGKRTSSTGALGALGELDRYTAGASSLLSRLLAQRPGRPPDWPH